MLFIAYTLAVAGAIALLVLWGRTRRKHVDFPVPADAALPSLLRSMAGLTWGHLTEGNRVTIVQNSAFFDALLEDMAKARESVHLETFLWQDGAVSERVTAALCARSRAGIEVRVIADQRGALQTSPATWARLRQAGVDFRVYHRPRLRELVWYNRRDHRKIVVIDGCVGYTFGHGIADMWGASEAEPTGWRDTAARFEGPVVNDLQAAFLDNWTKITRQALVGERYFPKLPATGTTPVHVAYVSQAETATAVQRLYELAIAAARRELILQNPYFIPGRRAIALCRAAVARGVDVRLMLPTAETSDFPVVQHASHASYGPLLAAGVRIYEFTRCGIHQKVMIVDGEWCSIGSTNFDPRSFRINDEITVALYDPDVAAELRRAFHDDLTHATEWTLERWNARTPVHRAVDALSVLGKRQL